MPRSYDIRAAAFACGANTKWVENLLSRYELPGVARARQGIQRRISDDGLLAIELVRVLNHEVGVSVARAAEIARRVMTSRSTENVDRVEVSLASGCDLRIDIASLELRLRREVINAMEALGQVKRGRPRRTVA